jgi:hypothetical protein
MRPERLPTGGLFPRTRKHEAVPPPPPFQRWSLLLHLLVYVLLSRPPTCCFQQEQSGRFFFLDLVLVDCGDYQWLCLTAIEPTCPLLHSRSRVKKIDEYCRIFLGPDFVIWSISVGWLGQEIGPAGRFSWEIDHKFRFHGGHSFSSAKFVNSEQEWLDWMSIIGIAEFCLFV